MPTPFDAIQKNLLEEIGSTQISTKLRSPKTAARLIATLIVYLLSLATWLYLIASPTTAGDATAGVILGSAVYISIIGLISEPHHWGNYRVTVNRGDISISKYGLLGAWSSINEAYVCSQHDVQPSRLIEVLLSEKRKVMKQEAKALKAITDEKVKTQNILSTFTHTSYEREEQRGRLSLRSKE